MDFDFGPKVDRVLGGAPLSGSTPRSPTQAPSDDGTSSSMSASSRPSLTGLSRPPQPSSVPLSGAQRVWQRYAFFGAAVALLLSLLSFVPVDVAVRSWSELILSSIFSSVLFALLLSSVGSLIVGFAPTDKRSHFVAGVTCATLVAAYLMLRGAGEVFRLHAGQTLNLGVVEFATEGAAQLLVPLVFEYPVEVLVLLLSIVGLFAFAVFVFNKSQPFSGRGPLLLRGAASLGGFVVLVQMLLAPNCAEQGHITSTADLSFLASVGERSREEAGLSELTTSAVLVQKSPKRTSASLWEKSAPLMQQRRPNVVLIQLESVGINHLGYLGYERPTTPNIDRLAARSVRFSEARTTATHSNYAQMATLSSLFPRRYSGLDTYRRLDYPRVLWHDVLVLLGYDTASYSSQDESWQGMLRFETTDTPHPIFHAGNYEGKKVVMGSERTVPDEVTSERAAKFIDSQNEPFAVYINFQATHFPYVVPATHRKRYLPDTPTQGKFHYLKYPAQDRKIVINRYDNALRHVDEQVGRVLDAIERSGQLENTIVILTSDHGEMFGEHNTVTHGRTLFEPEARVPLLISYPTHLEPATLDRPVSTLDVMPTLLGLLGLPAHPAYQGQDVLSPAPQKSERATFLNIQGMRCREGIVCGGYKLTRDPQGSRPALFDLSADPREDHNLVNQEPEIAAVLNQSLDHQMKAQMLYHARNQTSLREAFFAPRMLECPELPAPQKIVFDQPASEKTPALRTSQASEGEAAVPASTRATSRAGQASL